MSTPPTPIRAWSALPLPFFTYSLMDIFPMTISRHFCQHRTSHYGCWQFTLTNWERKTFIGESSGRRDVRGEYVQEGNVLYARQAWWDRDQPSRAPLTRRRIERSAARRPALTASKGPRSRYRHAVDRWLNRSAAAEVEPSIGDRLEGSATTRVKATRYAGLVLPATLRRQHNSYTSHTSSMRDSHR